MHTYKVQIIHESFYDESDTTSWITKFLVGHENRGNMKGSLTLTRHELNALLFPNMEEAKKALNYILNLIPDTYSVKGYNIICRLKL